MCGLTLELEARQFWRPWRPGRLSVRCNAFQAVCSIRHKTNDLRRNRDRRSPPELLGRLSARQVIERSLAS